MNAKWIEYIKQINLERQKYKWNKYNYTFSDSVIQERIMRLWIENRLYEPVWISELEQLAIATIREDLIKKSNLLSITSKNG